MVGGCKEAFYGVVEGVGGGRGGAAVGGERHPLINQTLFHFRFLQNIILLH